MRSKETASLFVAADTVAAFVYLATNNDAMKALTMSAARRRDKVVILTGPFYGASLSTHRVKFSTSDLFAIVSKLLRALFCDKACGVFCCIGILAMWLFACLENDHGVGYSCLAMMPWMIAFTAREMKKGVPA